ncbi:MAG: polysaccharide deacetylase [Lachnospiraceae bacterium]|nr:polysaccharide deacetylase [Lachnospiraceae bacterium]
MSEREKEVLRVKIFIAIMVILILLPTIVCIFMLIRLQTLSKQIEDIQLKADYSKRSRLIRDEETYETLLSAELGKGNVSTMPGGARINGLTESQEKVLGVNTYDSGDYAEYSHLVYLTFDDGPSRYTDDILDILNQYGVKATFFVVGKEDVDSKNAYRRIVDEGHTLGMHSYTHKYSELYASKESFIEDFEKLQDYLYDLTGVESRYYRFPGGSSNTVSQVNMSELEEFLDSRGVTFYDWNIVSGDAAGRWISSEAIVKNATKDIEGWHTCVILFHDAADKRTTVDALPEIIEKIQDMDDTIILPITESTVPVQHINANSFNR